jgi:hypothetical protein
MPLVHLIAIRASLALAQSREDITRTEKLAARVAGYSVVLTVVPQPRLAKGVYLTYSGASDGATAPRRIVLGLEIACGARKVRVPRSCYADLAEQDKLQCHAAKGRLYVAIIGGDASTSYRAAIEIRGLRTVRRSVSEGEFPAYDHEETTYVSGTPPG